MPKRIPTPPPPEDEPRYLTVVHPYPLHANLDLPADQRTLALWLACCTGKDVLLAMFHKPASPGMVVIEVDREFDRFDDLLGLHAWSGFLRKPSEEQMDKSSKVFYCTYNTGRLVEKNGWKRLSIEENWFQGWSANNSVIEYPYPKTSYCNVPSEAKTGAPMCRPLPQRSFPVPPPTPEPKVGSPEWLAARNANESASPAPSSTKKGKRTVASDTASVTSGSSRSTKSFSPPATQSPTPSVMANYRAKNDPAWKRVPPSIAAVTSRAPSIVGSSGARSSRAAAAPPASPGLALGITSQSRAPRRSDGSDGVEYFGSEKIKYRSARSPASSVSTGPARRQPYDPDGPVEPPRVYDYNEEDQPRYPMAAAMSDIIDDELASIATSVRSGSGGTRPLDLGDPDCIPGNSLVEAAAPASDHPRAGDAATVWDDYAKPREKEPPKKGEWECSQHGPVCSPGICKERARVEREKRESDRRKKWDAEKKLRDERREKARKKRGKKAEATGEGKREIPPHLPGNAPSSSNNNNINKSDNDPSHDRDFNATAPSNQEDQSILLNTGGADTPSTVSSSRRVCGPVGGSDEEENDDDEDEDEDDEEDGASVARSHTTNTSSAASRRSRAPSPASVSSIGQATTPRSSGPIQVSLTSPRPATQQSASDARSAASQSSSVGGRSGERLSVSSNSRAPAVSGASATGSDTDQHSGMGPATQQSSRSSATSSVQTSAGPSNPSTSSVASGFPTFADTEWGDPIAVALAKEGKKKKSKNSRKREDRERSARAVALVLAQATHANVLESALNDQLPPGGPGSSWGDPNDMW